MTLQPGLLGAIRAAASAPNPSGPHTFRTEDGRVRCTTGDLLARAHRYAHEVSEQVPRPHDPGPHGRPRLAAADDLRRSPTLLVACAEPLLTLVAFLAALYLNVRPIVLPRPMVIGRGGDLEATVASVRSALGVECHLVTEPETPGATAAGSLLPAPRPDTPIEDPWECADVEDAYRTDDVDRVAFLQRTSATTGDARMVGISHRNILSQVRAIPKGMACEPHERMATWLPMHHDMGLVGATLMPLCNGFGIDAMAPHTFVRDPLSWLRLMSDEGSTLTTAPTFAYDMVGRAAARHGLPGALDLSAVRRCVVGAEPIRRGPLARFVEGCAEAGLPRDALVPAYGLAESTLASVMATPGRPPEFAVVDLEDVVPGRDVGGCPDHVESTEPAVARATASHRRAEVCSVGTPLDGVSVTLTDEAGRPVTGDGVVGELRVGGDARCRALWREGEWQLLDADEPHPTGDLAFRRGREYFIVERQRNILVRQGRNVPSSQLEAVLSEILVHPEHHIHVVERGLFDADEEVCAVVECFSATRSVDPRTMRLARGAELPVDRIVLAEGRVIARTTSGKKRAPATRAWLHRQLADAPATQGVRIL